MHTSYPIQPAHAHANAHAHSGAGAVHAAIPTPTGFYERLKLTATASTRDIEFAYRALARMHYAQDKPSAAAQMQFDAVAQAYGVLSNPETRAVYDDFEQRGHQCAASAATQPINGKTTHIAPAADNAWDSNVAFSGSAFGRNLNERRSDFFESLWRGLESDSGVYRPDTVARPGTQRSTDIDQARHARVCISQQAAHRGGRCVVRLRVPQVDARGSVELLECELAVTIPKGAHSGERLCIAGDRRNAVRPVEPMNKTASRRHTAPAAVIVSSWNLQLEVH